MPESSGCEKERFRAAREAFRTELRGRGYRVAGDTGGLMGELYAVGERDLARALFEFKATADEAFETMYQGAWGKGMPPRFAVLPKSEATSTALDVLEQAGIRPLFYVRTESGVTFDDLGPALALMT